MLLAHSCAPRAPPTPRRSRTRRWLAQARQESPSADGVSTERDSLKASAGRSPSMWRWPRMCSGPCRMSGPHDRFVRYTLGHPERAAAELRAALPARLVARVDWSTLRREPSNVVDAQLRETQSDSAVLRAADRRRARAHLRAHRAPIHRGPLDGAADVEVRGAPVGGVAPAAPGAAAPRHRAAGAVPRSRGAMDSASARGGVGADARRRGGPGGSTALRVPPG